jgi:hypothetical protein
LTVNLLRTVAAAAFAACVLAAVAADECPLRLRLAADKPAYRHPAADRPAAAGLTLEVKNTTGAPLALRFGSAQHYDFVLFDKAGNELTRWSAERAFAAVLTSLTLAPGETKKFTDALPLAAGGRPLPAGDYEIEGVLATLPPRSAARVTIRIAH